MHKQERLQAVVSGEVQGVGFRAFAMRHAQKLGLAGWVRNRSDGKVELEAQGPRSHLEELVEALRRGPSYSRVRDVSVNWVQTSHEPVDEGFTVRW